jgi:hypothetical protein
MASNIKISKIEIPRGGDILTLEVSTPPSLMTSTEATTGTATTARSISAAVLKPAVKSHATATVSPSVTLASFVGSSTIDAESIGNNLIYINIQLSLKGSMSGTGVEVLRFNILTFPPAKQALSIAAYNSSGKEVFASAWIDNSGRVCVDGFDWIGATSIGAGTLVITGVVKGK